MNTFNPKNIATLPSLLTYQPSCIRSIPMSVEISDAWGNGGSGIGIGSKAIQSSIGEFFERRHFYMEIMPDQFGTLDYSLTPVEKITFLNAFNQTCKQPYRPQAIEKHEFSLTEVYRSSDFSSCHIPTACISLSSHKHENDSLIYPQRDTCGCSFHWDPLTAIFGSLKEQLERQFLARFWLTKKCKNLIIQTEAIKSLKESNSLELYMHLLRSGEITILDISDPDFPGACILTVYGNNQKSRHVNYCAGMSYATNIEEAIEKSVNELWQTFRFIDSFCVTQSEKNEIDDSYLRHFLNCNNYKTYETITSVNLTSSLQATHPLEFSTEGLLNALSNNNITGFIYLKPITINNTNYYASKYLSPELFLHMNNSENINLHNTYSEKFFHEIHDDRKKFMVPFP